MNRLAHSVLKEIGFTLLAEGKTLKVKAEGYSMYPTIKPGSVIYIEPAERGNEPVPGEIIAWKKESGFVVHRLIKVLKE
ncbi:MAG: S24/S26 family peptidase, partial [Bacteroidales bacterium]